MREATGRVVALDGTLWRTLFALVTKPGLLTRDYFAGRRKRYVHPARLYLAISLILFAALRITTGPVQLAGDFVVLELDAPSHAFGEKDSVTGAGSDAATSATPGVAERPNMTMDRDLNLVVKGMRGPFIERVTAQIARFNRLPKQEKADQMVGGMLRRAPYAMILLLPAFAGLQQLSYLGRSRRYAQRPRGYTAHLIFSANLHSFIFLACAVAIALPSVALRWAIAAYIAYYVVRSTRSIYGGPVAGVIVRVLGVMFAYAFVILFATIALLGTAILLR
jgi:hypothetical protein